jgi:dihydroxyacetone kinase
LPADAVKFAATAKSAAHLDEGVIMSLILNAREDFAAQVMDISRARDFVVFKIAGAAAEDRYDLAGVAAMAARANARTRSIGVAFDGCTLPGADAPLFTLPDTTVGWGLGIHGKPGVGEGPLPGADKLPHDAAVTGQDIVSDQI